MGDICKIVWFGDKGLVRAHVLVKILTPLSFFFFFFLFFFFSTFKWVGVLHKVSPIIFIAK